MNLRKNTLNKHKTQDKKHLDLTLYAKLSCALTHSISDCDECRKCGANGVEARMNLVNELANLYLNKGVKDE